MAGRGEGDRPCDGSQSSEQPVRAGDRHLLLVHLALIHSYTTVFWWCAGIFAAGAVICGVLLRRGPLTRPQDSPTREPVRETAAARP